METKIYRIIDANLNRFKEGIRVVEDIQRYIFDDKELSLKLKNLRHLGNLKSLKLQINCLNSRDANLDVLKKSIDLELQRKDLSSVLTANLKRSQESARVLEEIFKLIDLKLSQVFKNARYELYNLEKEILTKFLERSKIGDNPII
ncbi:thiamine-phosphate pyrophosphorylase [Campylobacter ureolyticus]|uniref:Thiamine-phosphate pyrophosphorylase n=1 Tax=Campylobacter ureolyticus TaxID=827 RepID=A0A9Q4KPH1_9BACT|nr:thiamine-phosphate pyrophosphorylase [Campylobacter ureolyticus]MCZ6102668.1 thiamine-phosphate pyrophosphorylase [Campylobacter ureolyticus]MCZ6117134.1 thiamine-phosphate pyrophosphorylase [Campylobacter ureolyticus]MCZ6161549.1 thiamine-phosphate pyrophosphorylase [Campylobacter ureolyticus]MCZ6170167.1 thiamine-phosphate pyrophosphorylase [Campylobacter ureolyticus]MCZ6185859.1 thiamine-phosphate pyrophosphorylase [Campylobacter ureolyticus]